LSGATISSDPVARQLRDVCELRHTVFTGSQHEGMAWRRRIEKVGRVRVRADSFKTHATIGASSESQRAHSTSKPGVCGPRSVGRMTPRAAFDSRDKAMPRTVSRTLSKELRVRHDRIDQHGSVTIRYKSKLHQHDKILLGSVEPK